MLSNRRIFWTLLYAVVLLGSFFITLWLTAPETVPISPNAFDPQSVAFQLARYRLTSISDLNRTARGLGLRFSPELKGNVDEMTRVNERDIKMSGWLADPRGASTPLEVMVFLGGTAVGFAQTTGERPDVTAALHLAFGAEKNVAFSVAFPCRGSDQPLIVGIGTEKQYVSLQTSPCP